MTNRTLLLQEWEFKNDQSFQNARQRLAKGFSYCPEKGNRHRKRPHKDDMAPAGFAGAAVPASATPVGPPLGVGQGAQGRVCDRVPSPPAMPSVQSTPP